MKTVILLPVVALALVLTACDQEKTRHRSRNNLRNRTDPRSTSEGRRDEGEKRIVRLEVDDRR